MPQGRDPQGHYKSSSSNIFINHKNAPSHGSVRVGMPSREQGEIPPGSQNSQTAIAVASASANAEQRRRRNDAIEAVQNKKQPPPPVPSSRGRLSGHGYQGTAVAVPPFPGYLPEEPRPVRAPVDGRNKQPTLDKAPMPESETQHSRASTPVSEMGSLFVSGDTPDPSAGKASTRSGSVGEDIVYESEDSPIASTSAGAAQPIRSFPTISSDRNNATTGIAQGTTPANRPKRHQPAPFYGPTVDAYDAADADERRALALALKKNEKLSQLDPDFHGEYEGLETQDLETSASAAMEQNMELSDDEVNQVGGGSASSGNEHLMDVNDDNIRNEPIEPVTPHSRKRPSPERTLSSVKRTRTARKDPEPKFHMRRYNGLDTTGPTRSERTQLLKEIQKLWQTPWEETIPQDLWPLESQRLTPINPRDLSNPGLMKYKQLAQASPGKEGLQFAIREIRKLVGRRQPPQDRLLYLIDVDNVIKKLRQRRLRDERRRSLSRRDSGSGLSSEEIAAIKTEGTPTSPIGGFSKQRALQELNAADVAALDGSDLGRLYKLFDREVNRRLEQGKTDGSSREAAISLD